MLLKVDRFRRGGARSRRLGTHAAIVFANWVTALTLVLPKNLIANRQAYQIDCFAPSIIRYMMAEVPDLG